MKVLYTFLALLVSVAIYAQDKAPVFEKDGKQIKATYFHDNGEIAQIGFFVNGKLDGEWKMYNEEGKKIAMGQYDMGIKTGKWFFWSDAGLKEVDYQNNRIANVTIWNTTDPVVLNK